jgi:hypothetical protein
MGWVARARVCLRREQQDRKRHREYAQEQAPLVHGVFVSCDWVRVCKKQIETENLIIEANCDLFVELSISQSSRVQVNKQPRQ